MSERDRGHGNPRRTFLVGLLTGAGVAAAVSAVALPRPSEAKKVASGGPAGRSEPILYQRTPEAERYYKTLYL